MPLVSITRKLTLKGVIERLEREILEQRASSLAFFEIAIDKEIADTVYRLLQQRKRRFTEVAFFLCPDNSFLMKILKSLLSLNLCGQIRIRGAKERNDDSSSPSLEFLSVTNNCLVTLNLSFLTLQDNASHLQMGIENNPQLEQLLLSNIIFSDSAAVKQIQQAFYSSHKLKTIALNSCGLTDTNMAFLLKPLITKTSITSLRLFGNQCRDESLNILARLLSFDKCRLESLDLHHQSSSQSKMRLHFLNESWPSRKSNKSLKRFNLSGDGLGNDDMEPLANFLNKLSNLQELDLDGNAISDAGLETMTLFFYKRSKLRVLRLLENPLSHKAAPALLELLKHHPQLHTVTPSTYWKLSTNYGHLIKTYLCRNRAGRVLLMDNQNNKIAQSVWPTILARLTNPYLFLGNSGVNGLFYLLRHGPVVLEHKFVSADEWKLSRLKKRKRNLVCREEDDPFEALVNAKTKQPRLKR